METIFIISADDKYKCVTCILCINMDEWWVGTIHLYPFMMIAPPGRRGVFSQHRRMSLKFFVLTISGDHSAAVRRSLLHLQWHARTHTHTQVFEKNKASGARRAKGIRTCRCRVLKPNHVSPQIYWISHLLIVDFFLKHLLPGVRFLSSPLAQFHELFSVFWIHLNLQSLEMDLYLGKLLQISEEKQWHTTSQTGDPQSHPPASKTSLVEHLLG